MRLGADLLHAFSTFRLWPLGIAIGEDREHISSISDVLSGNVAPATSLSSAEAAVLAETFRKVPFPH